MKVKLRTLFLALAFLAFQGCAATPRAPENKPLIPLDRANLQAVFEENEGLEVLPEDAKELRDFYRGGVQQKAKAEKEFQEKSYPEAMKLYRSSNQFFLTLIRYIDEDAAVYNLFEGTDILFFPTLLMADNHLKIGLICQAMGRDWRAKYNWKRALSLVKQSLQAEPTEWGLALEQELLSLLAAKKK